MKHSKQVSKVSMNSQKCSLSSITLISHDHSMNHSKKLTQAWLHETTRLCPQRTSIFPALPFRGLALSLGYFRGCLHANRFVEKSSWKLCIWNKVNSLICTFWSFEHRFQTDITSDKWHLSVHYIIMSHPYSGWNIYLKNSNTPTCFYFQTDYVNWVP